ncbi:hypothetical protein THAOC_34156 [Thalassiosira oceanica]|uniref:Uncharacterized protein n=1 Tax=Thalassiosira oceanica TaxID=159749 RepID=K0R3Y2_THAOC|nr:hypothetical protein THAOC_34156 [Thalassiosira oceanica]|eukprot:EJK47150.1 hypothetical protein THAOC_34156 [Thalassiosira oceanica]
MPRRAGAGGGLVPGPSNLRRLTAGDHLLERAPPWECGDDGQYDRVIGFYDSAKLIDDNLWVLYSDYFDKFEIINIDTGRGVKHFYPENGPGDYESHYESRISLLLTCYGGRHGMLAAGMDSSKRRNPHGAWSGPYMSLWNISPSNPESPTNRKPVMSIDLCRSSYTIVAVSVVSTERVCILLSGPDGVELQWHRIPQNADEMHRGRPPHPQPDRPGAAPPPHQCSSACPFMRRCPEKQKMDVWKSSKEFWQEYDARAPNSTAASEKKYSYESRCEYIWWPGQSTLLQADSITRKNVNSATMESDGGMLVIVADAVLQLWHCGTMSNLRDVSPFLIYEEQSLEYHFDDCTVEEELEQYNEACKTGRLWCSTLTSYYSCREDGMESVYMLCWERGGLFDFEDGPSDQSRLERLTGALAHLQLRNQAIEPSLRMYGDIGQEIFKQRGTSSLAIDSSKLVVCTRYEVAVMPFSLTAESSPSLDEKWVDTFDEESNQYFIGIETPLWYSARPLHSNFLRQWNSIRMMASRSYSPDEPANAFRSVAEEMSISLDYEKELMEFAVLCSPMIRSACISWRRLALVTSLFDDNLDGHHLLHVYDILCDWTDSTGGRFDVEERGVGFSEDTEEDDTEEDDTEEDDTEEDD